MSLALKVGKGITSLAVAQVARRLVSIGVTAMLARLLIPEDFGLIALTMVAVQFLGIFTDTGLTTALIQRKQVDHRQLSTAFWFNLAVCTGLCAIGVILAPALAEIFREPRIIPLVRAMLLTLPVAAMGQISDSLLQRQLSFGRLAIIEWLASLLAGITAVVLAVSGFGVWALVGQALALSVMSTVGKLSSARWLPSTNCEFSQISPLFRFGSWVMACGLINYATINAQALVIGRTLGATELGYYVIALNLVMLPATAIGGLVSRVMFPALSSVQDDLGPLQSGYLRMLRVVSTLTFPIVVGLGVTADLAVTILYGSKWAPVVALVQILGVWGLLQAVNVSGAVFYAKARPHLLALYALASFCLVAAAVVTGGRWGAVGVAWGLIAVSPAVCIGPHLIAAHVIALPWRRLILSVAPPLASALAMGTAVLLANHALGGHLAGVWPRMILLAILGSAVYVGLLVSIGICGGHGRRLLPWLTGAERVPMIA